MRARTWGIIVAVNVILAAIVVLIMIAVWPDGEAPIALTGTPIAGDVDGFVDTTHSPPAESPTPAPTGTTAPLQYIVQSGDTLSHISFAYDISIEELMAANGLTDRDVLQIGQVIEVPVHHTPTPTASPAPNAPSPTPVPPTATPEPSPSIAPTVTPAGPPAVEIAQVIEPGNLAEEVIIIHNYGGVVDMEGWTLSDAAGNTFTFPALTLFNAQVRLHTALGLNTPSDLYWGRAEPAWGNGELITLSDREGRQVDAYIVQ